MSNRKTVHQVTHTDFDEALEKLDADHPARTIQVLHDHLRRYLVHEHRDIVLDPVQLCVNVMSVNKHRYIGKDNYERPRLEYLCNIVAMSDNDLFKEAKQKIWLSAFANNNRNSDYHREVDFCADEMAARRGGSLDWYGKAYDEVKRELGH